MMVEEFGVPSFKIFMFYGGTGSTGGPPTRGRS